MRFDTHPWISRLKAVEREFRATLFSTQDTLRRARLDTCVLLNGISVTDLVRSVDNLEGTFTVRMFSEFETGLRTYWCVVRKNPPPSKAKPLIDSLAAYCGIPPTIQVGTHSIREYRNFLVHERDDDFEPISLAISRSDLGHFMSFLR